MLESKTIKAAIYCRTALADDQCINAQIETGKQICAEQGFEVGGIYADNGFNGLNFDRPAFQQMMTDIENGKIDAVVTRSASRLGRDFIQTRQCIDRIGEQGVELFFAGSPVQALGGLSLC